MFDHEFTPQQSAGIVRNLSQPLFPRQLLLAARRIVPARRLRVRCCRGHSRLGIAPRLFGFVTRHPLLAAGRLGLRCRIGFAAGPFFSPAAAVFRLS